MLRSTVVYSGRVADGMPGAVSACVARVLCAALLVLAPYPPVGAAAPPSPVAPHLFALLPVYPTFENSPNALCRNDTALMRQQLDQFKLWAVKMLDASAKLPSGVLAGNVHQLGHFDECLSVGVQPWAGSGGGSDGGRTLRGQYCLARVEYAPHNLTVHTQPVHMFSQLFNTSAWSYIKAFNMDRSRNRRDEMHWAVCVPDSCSAEDVAEEMQAVLRHHQHPAGIDVTVSVPPHMCQVASSDHLLAWVGFGQIVFGIVVAFFISAVMLSTALQGIGRIAEKEASGIGKFLNCFSGQNNFQALHKVDASKDIMVVHTMRFISMIVILMGHRFITDAPAPRFNADYSEDNVHNPGLIYTMVGPVLVVDTFFLLSGFLTANQIFNDLEAGRFKLFSFYLHRYIRLTPVYMLVVAFFALILVHLGSGPLWLSRVTLEQERCAHNWWVNLLYINNYVNTDQLCMFQSWHLSCDFHFLLMAPPLVYLLWKMPRIAITTIFILIGVCSALLFSITWIYNLDANLLAYKSVLSDLSADPTFRNTYIPTHTRFGPYLFGLLASYAYFKRKSYGVLPETFTYGGAVVVGILLNIPVATALIFYAEGFEYDVWTAALYASLHRIPWSIGLCLILVVTATNNAYFFQSMLSWQALAPLSRLTYCVFLIHSSVQLFSAASLRVAPYNDHFSFAWTLLGDILMTYLLALIVHLFFEAPILRLDRAYWSTNKSSRMPHGLENRAFAVDPVPAVFSNADGPFTITSTEHKKYRQRQTETEPKPTCDDIQDTAN